MGSRYSASRIAEILGCAACLEYTAREAEQQADEAAPAPAQTWSRVAHTLHVFPGFGASACGHYQEPTETVWRPLTGWAGTYMVCHPCFATETERLAEDSTAPPEPDAVDQCEKRPITVYLTGLPLDTGLMGLTYGSVDPPRVHRRWILNKLSARIQDMTGIEPADPSAAPPRYTVRPGGYEDGYQHGIRDALKIIDIVLTEEKP